MEQMQYHEIANGTLVKTLDFEEIRKFFLSCSHPSSIFLDTSEEFEISEVTSPWAVH